MLSLNYFSYVDNSEVTYNRCNKKSDALPFVVNCAGVTATEQPYRTHNINARVDWYLMYIKSGTLFVTHQGKDSVYTSGTFILFPPGYQYCYHHDEEKPIECYWIHFSGSDAERALKYYGFKIFPETNSIKPDAVIDSRYTNIFNTFLQSDKFRDRELSILFDRLLLSFAKRAQNINSVRTPLSKSISFINENYNDHIYIPDLAALESLSLSRYNILFRQATGMSPGDYIKQTRLNAACELLLSTDLPVNIIGQSVGYENQCFFSKIFKKTVGVTPSEYRHNK